MAINNAAFPRAPAAVTSPQFAIIRSNSHARFTRARISSSDSSSAGFGVFLFFDGMTLLTPGSRCDTRGSVSTAFAPCTSVRAMPG